VIVVCLDVCRAQRVEHEGTRRFGDRAASVYAAAMGNPRDATLAHDALLRALDALNARLDALEARVSELECENDALRGAGQPFTVGPEARFEDAGSDLWVEQLPDAEPAQPSDPEVMRLLATLARAPHDTRALARLAERAELLGDLHLAVDTLERLADELPTGRDRRRALLHAARLARTGLDDAPRALGLARTVLVDHPADAEAHRLVSLYALR